jgi:ubiquinone/menaquinone biosynthesis C-methylase UbiE
MLRPADYASVSSSERLPESWPPEELEAVDRCPLCGCADRSLLHPKLTDRVFFCAPGKWSLYQCRGCEAAYLDPRPTSKSIARAYSSYYTHEPEGEAGDLPSPLGRFKLASSNAYLNARYKFELSPAPSWSRWAVTAVPPVRLKKDRAARHLRLEHRGARLLDIGCGNGAFVRAARVWGWDAEGVDPDPRAAAVGRKMGVPITVGSLPKLGYPDASFAAVTMNHSIEHLHDPVAGLREVRRILQPAGTVWINTPNLDSRGHRIFGANWRGLEPPRHLVLFSAASLMSALSRAGFAQIRQVHAPFTSQWYFTSSYRLANNEDCTHGSRLPPWLRLEAIIADWRTLFHKQSGEEIIFLADAYR